jgi:hypothetical protein
MRPRGADLAQDNTSCAARCGQDNGEGAAHL